MERAKKLILFFIFIYAVNSLNAEKINYDVILEINDYESDLPAFFNDELKEQMFLFKYKKRPIRSFAILKERISSDIELIENRMRSLGFFGAEINSEQNTNNNEVIITMNIKTGPLFKIEQINIVPLSGSISHIKNMKKLSKFIKRSSSFAHIAEINQIILETLKNKGFPEAKIIKKKAEVDHKTSKVRLKYTVSMGEKAFFSDTNITGAKNISLKFIKNRINWKKGELYSQEKVNKTRRDILDTQLFAGAKIKPGQIKNNKLPMNVILKEDLPHMLEFSAMYSTFRNTGSVKDRISGVYGTASWTHFNCFGGGEKLKISFEGTPPVKSADKNQKPDFIGQTELTNPDFFGIDKHLTSKLKAGQEWTPGYLKHGASVQFTTRILQTDYLQYLIGTSFEKYSVNDWSEKKSCSFYGIPFEVLWNNTDDALNPTEGEKASLNIYPQKGTIKEINDSHNTTIALTKLRSSKIIKINKKLSFAAWGAVSRIAGISFKDLPADKRIYAGGLNSIRGYGNQMAGPFDKTYWRPVGGISSIELGGEIRPSITEEIGGVAFIEGAKVSSSSWPLSGDKWYVGVGVGARYFTRIGPLRIDLAVPTKRRKYIDSKLQVLISIGQAF